MGGQLVFCCAVDNICRVNMLLSGARVSVLASGTKRFCLRFFGWEISCCVWAKPHLRPSGTREHKTRGKRSRSGTGIHGRRGQRTRYEHGKVSHNESRRHKHLLLKNQNESSEAVMRPREHVVR